MSRKTALPLAVGLTLVAAGSVVPAQQKFRAGIDVVHVPVVVTREKTILRGLKVGDFEIREDGRKQDITFFAEGAPGAPLPLHLGLLLDTSGSMSSDLREAADAAVRFVNALEEAVDVVLVDFETEIHVGRFAPESFPRLFERIRARKAGGGTALYDALGLYLTRAQDEQGQHVLVMYSDGGDSTSSLTFDKLQRMLRGSDVLVYAVGYLQNQTSSSRTGLQMRIAQIAEETGGEAFFPSSAKEIQSIYTKILDELVSRYTLGYVSSNPTIDGKFRKIEVRLTPPDLKRAKVRARPGYYSSTTLR